MLGDGTRTRRHLGGSCGPERVLNGKICVRVEFRSEQLTEWVNPGRDKKIMRWNVWVG